MKLKAIVIALIFSLFTLTGLAADNAITGYWKVFDAKSQQVLAIVQIYPAGNVIEGRVVKIMPVLGQKPTDVCQKCKGAMHNKPIMGMRIVWGMEQVAPNTWGKGRVLDTKSGGLYKGTMTLIDNGNRLKLRGYIGVPILGRTETWIRTSGK